MSDSLVVEGWVSGSRVAAIGGPGAGRLGPVDRPCSQVLQTTSSSRAGDLAWGVPVSRCCGRAGSTAEDPPGGRTTRSASPLVRVPRAGDVSRLLDRSPDDAGDGVLPGSRPQVLARRRRASSFPTSPIGTVRAPPAGSGDVDRLRGAVRLGPEDDRELGGAVGRLDDAGFEPPRSGGT